MGFVKNFLSGVESGQHYQAAIDAGAEHLLMSYLYITKQSGNILHQRKVKNPDLKFLIDSGAHTLQVSMDKAPYNTWTMVDLENYVIRYAKWLEANRKDIFAAVELDVAYSVNHINGKAPNDPYGDTVIDTWRKKYFVPLLNSGMNIIFVWHTSQGYDGWENLCANFPYVGLPGEMSKNSDFNTYMTVARRYLTKVHGFAATKQADYRDWPWYSVDSTTWKAGEIYGTLPVWDERRQKLRFLAKGEREPYRHVFEEQRLDADKIIQDSDYQEVTRSSLKSMVGMELFYKERFKNRTFYYELRLAPPSKIQRQLKKAGEGLRLWASLFQAERCFPAHAKETNEAKVWSYIHAIACAQYRDLPKLTPEGDAFLRHYFPTVLNQPIPDTLVLAKELAVIISPGNEAALMRVSEDDYVDSNNPPKRRQLDRIPDDEDFPEWLLEELSLSED